MLSAGQTRLGVARSVIGEDQTLQLRRSKFVIDSLRQKLGPHYTRKGFPSQPTQFCCLSPERFRVQVPWRTHCGPPKKEARLGVDTGLPIIEAIEIDKVLMKSSKTI
jgi:hypothetical protein